MLLINLYHGGFRLEEDREGKGKKKKKEDWIDPLRHDS